MNEFYIYGASGHGKVVLETSLKEGKKPIAFIDDDENLNEFQGFTVKHEMPEGSNFIIAIGSNFIREVIQKKYNGNELTTVTHPSALISEKTVVGKGTLIGVGAIINSDSSIGSNCIINSAAVIEHDCNIENIVHISPNATICGNVKIGKGTHVGAGAVVLPNITIGEWVVIGAGAIVTKDLPDGVTVVGNPARIIKVRNA